MKKLVLMTAMAMVLGMLTSAQANLSVSGTVFYEGENRNLIYDDILNITWLDYVKGPDWWDNQNNWAESLFTNSGWELATVNHLLSLNGNIGLFASLTSSYPDYYNRYYWSRDAVVGFWGFYYTVNLQNSDIWEMRNNNGVAGLAVHSGQISGTSVPAPAAILLLGSGLAGLAGLRRRSKR